MSSALVPLKALTEQVAEAIDGRRVRAAVFTTFSFDPGFFELNVLPVLFDQPFSQPDKVRRLQLEDALRTIDHVAVYFDRRALSQDGEPAQLDYRRIDVSRQTGYFHPKVILILVDDWNTDRESASETETSSGPRRQSLIVGILSANLTRAGWWENVECAHLEEIRDVDVDGARCAFRPDLLSLIRRIRQAAAASDNQGALEQISDFLLQRTPRDRVGKNRAAGTFHTRLFGGQTRETLSDWLWELNLDRAHCNLEVISPFFDADGAGPLASLIEALNPREVRVYLPTGPDGAALVKPEAYRAIASCENTGWARLPGEVVSRGRTEDSERLAPRRVHAKVYRIWRKDGPDLLLVGSPNLTRAGHSHGGAGNLEAAFLVDVTRSGYPRRWWLEPLDRDIERFAADAPGEEDGLDTVGLDVSLQFDWATGELSYRLTGREARQFTIAVAEDDPLAVIERPRSDQWTSCPKQASARLRDLLVSTSFLLIGHNGHWWRVLVREENMGHRPSVLMQLTPEEILEYWSLLTPAQRAHFIEFRVVDHVEGLAIGRTERLQSRNTLFDRFAGVYHAFGCLERAADEAIENGREHDAEVRLFGAKYDSLPSFLEKTVQRVDGDPILNYVTFLCAQQLRQTLRRRHPTFFRARRRHARQLERLLGRMPELRDAVPLPPDTGSEFLDWYERAFVHPVRGSGSPP